MKTGDAPPAGGTACRRTQNLAPVRFDPPAYDRWYTQPLGRYCLALEAEAMGEPLRGLEHGRVLEVGAGTGRFAAVLSDRAGCIIASDPDQRMAAWSATEGPAAQRAAWVAAAGQELPFADGVFDAAFTVTALCFAPEHERLIRELTRVVRPGGRIVLGELNALHPWQLWRRFKAVWPRSPYRLAHFHTPRGLERLLRVAGLVSVGHCTLLHWMPWSHPWLLAWAIWAERWGRKLAPEWGSFVVVWGERPAATEAVPAAHDVAAGP